MPKSFASRLASSVRWGLVLLGIYFIFSIFNFLSAAVSGSSLTDLVWLFAGELTTDSEDRTNFLVLGTGGAGHDGADLTDTFLVGSYSHTKQTLSMLSIPRDLYVEASDGYGMRINQIYQYEVGLLGDSETALEEVSELAARITDLPIHYYAKVNFQGFTDLIDALGGVKVLVPYEIDDPYYPCHNLLDYCPFHITEGVHTLDGETALMYARSRKTTSDFDRAARQQLILEAIRDKAQSSEILASPKRLRDIYEIVSENLESNLHFRELVALAKLSESLSSQNITSAVLSDEPRYTGGLLYAPNREDYGGAAVLIPAGESFREIHKLTSVIFDYPEVFAEQLPIEVLNASGTPRLAESAAYYLNRYGLNTAHIGNHPDSSEYSRTTVYYYDPADPVVMATVTVLKKFLPADYREGSADFARRGFPLTIVLGHDYQPEQ
jgi:LCP family protein required for cell wall assembly